MEPRESHSPSAELGAMFEVRVCECGVVASGFAQARCGRDRKRNMSVRCPTERVDVRVVAVDVPEGWR